MRPLTPEKGILRVPERCPGTFSVASGHLHRHIHASVGLVQSFSFTITKENAAVHHKVTFSNVAVFLMNLSNPHLFTHRMYTQSYLQHLNYQCSIKGIKR